MLTGIGTCRVMDLSTYFDESSWVVSPSLTSNSGIEIRNLLSSANVVLIGISQLVRLSVNRITQKKNYSADFHEIQWKGGTWTNKEETIRFSVIIRITLR